MENLKDKGEGGRANPLSPIWIRHWPIPGEKKNVFLLAINFLNRDLYPNVF